MKINSYAEFQGNEPCMRNFRICVSEYPPPPSELGFYYNVTVKSIQP